MYRLTPIRIWPLLLVPCALGKHHHVSELAMEAILRLAGQSSSLPSMFEMRERWR
jgi:hypothetical protein